MPPRRQKPVEKKEEQKLEETAKKIEQAIPPKKYKLEQIDPNTLRENEQIIIFPNYPLGVDLLIEASRGLRCTIVPNIIDTTKPDSAPIKGVIAVVMELPMEKLGLLPCYRTVEV